MHKSIQQLVDDINRETRYTSHLIGKDRLDQRVMKVMARVPREKFVAEYLQGRAFDNGPLPIGYGQTISQPYIVALMSDLLSPASTDRILEIGTGSGYQAAVLSQLCAQVFTVERISELSQQARTRFREMGYSNIKCRVGNGCRGWPEHAPYDGIIVTAAATAIPDELVEQLKEGGRLVIPLTIYGYHQELLRLIKDEQGNIHRESILGVAFVPLVDDEENDQ